MAPHQGTSHQEPQPIGQARGLEGLVVSLYKSRSACPPSREAASLLRACVGVVFIEEFCLSVWICERTVARVSFLM